MRASGVAGQMGFRSVILRRLSRKKSLVPAVVRTSASGIAPTTAIVRYQLTDVASSSL
jgi:hypothetical protein